MRSTWALSQDNKPLPSKIQKVNLKENQDINTRKTQKKMLTAAIQISNGGFIIEGVGFTIRGSERRNVDRISDRLIA